MKKILSLLLLLPLLFVGCTTEDIGPEIPDTGEILLDNTQLRVLNTGANPHYVHVTSPYAWSVQSSVDWITFENNRGGAGSSYLAMFVAENTKPAERQGVIYFTTDDYNLSAELLVMQEAGSKKSFMLVADKTTIYDNGIDGATFTLYYDGMILDNGYELYIGEGAEMVAGNKFTSTTQGTFEIWAAYGAAISNTVNINVIATPPAAPAAPEDNNPSKTNFVRRVLLTQFTGTGCGYCPYMINALYQVANDATLNSKVVFSAAHLFNETDPAYLSESATLDNAMGVTSYPNLVIDLNKNTRGIQPVFTDVSKAITTAIDRVAVKGGIAVSSEYHAEEEYIVLNATVKAKETTEFRVGAWLLEDGIKAKQGNNGITALPGVDFNTHNNCIRYANSQATQNVFSGYSLGVIEAGKTASHEFAFKLKANGTGSATKWNHDNLRVIVFITTQEGDNWYVNNVVECPKDGSIDFEYEN